ncbi:MAG: response regulator [Cyanobacteria bacterium P01_D01_bin.128]
MQGHLSEIDIRSILQLIGLGQRTGELYVEAYTEVESLRTADSQRSDSSPPRSWLVFFNSGKIVYAGTTDGKLTRLQHYLERYSLDRQFDRAITLDIAPFNVPEYGYFWTLLEEHTVSSAQGRAILQAMVYETLFDLLSLHQGTFVFKLGSALSPQLTTLDIEPLLVHTIQQIQVWNQLHPHIQSPDQVPTILDVQHLQARVSEESFNKLVHWIDGQRSIRQLARHLGRDITVFAKAIYPHIREGSIHCPIAPTDAPNLDSLSTEPVFNPLESWQATQVPRIVCIDDGAVIRQAVEQILDHHGYEVTSIGNPLKALGLLFQLNPDLILCDIAMPELEGYEVCAMLRQSSAFRQTPIIMLTGKDGFIDRIKARMTGATDYLTKPFGAHELLTLTEKYVGKGNPQRPDPADLLAVAIQDELNLDTLGTS